MYSMYRKEPLLEERSESSGRKWVVCLSVLTLTVCSAIMIFIAYHNHLFGLGVHCPKKSLLFKVSSPSMDRVLWDYATFWSNNAHNDRRLTFFIDPVDDHDPMTLFGLGDTFQPLSVRPCPKQCRKKSMKTTRRHLRKSKTTMPPMVDHGEPFGGLPLHPLFKVNLADEFRFRDDVMEEAVLTLMEIMEKMANESFDQLVTVYLSTSTPHLERALISGQNSTNISESQSAMLQSAIDSYRNASKPLFLFMGNQSEAAGIDGKDVFRQPDIPENVALAILSSSNETIFNHGLWPAFGALLAKSNVTSYAMDKRLLDAAKNASLNWKASIAY